ncbi:MAG: HlyC/CorC family transporter, partial [Rhodospirillaceae bacterium]
MILTLSIILFLIMLSAMFSGSETALTAASKAMMHDLEKKGDRRAGLVNRLIAQRERLIGTILLGNNLVNILASAIATSFFIELVGEAGVVYATFIMTVLVLLFAEILPKTIALTHTTAVARLVAPIMHVLTITFRPITVVFEAIISLILRVFRGSGSGDRSAAAALAELRGAIDLHEGTAEDDQETVRHERNMLRSVLDLQEVELNDITIHRSKMVSVDLDLPPSEIVVAVLDGPYTRVPVYKDRMDNIVGILHAKALFRAARNLEKAGKGLDDLDIAEIMAKPWFVPDTTTLFDQLQAFRERREHFSVVVDEYGSLLGIVTLEDILEEIVGEIDDEHDITVSGVRTQPDGSLLVNGDVTIRDLNREF